MRAQQLHYKAQVGRVANLVEEIRRAHDAHDFVKLVQLGNRLATDSVIAGALARDESERRKDGPAQAA